MSGRCARYAGRQGVQLVVKLLVGIGFAAGACFAQLTTLYEDARYVLFSVIVADSDAHYLVSRQTRDGLAAVGMALDSLVSPELKCSYGTADMEGAATLAQDILKKNSETEVILYTATEYIDKGNFTVVNVADESDWNVKKEIPTGRNISRAVNSPPINDAITPPRKLVYSK